MKDAPGNPSCYHPAPTGGDERSLAGGGREIPRTRVSLTSEGDEIILNVEASDLGALRAALNSYLGWISISEEIGKMVGEENG